MARMTMLAFFTFVMLASTIEPCPRVSSYYMPDRVVRDIEVCLDRVYRLSGAGATANSDDILFLEDCEIAAFASLNSAMLELPRIVFFMSFPLEVRRPIIRPIPIEVTALETTAVRANERREYQAMDKFRLPLTRAVTKNNSRITSAYRWPKNTFTNHPFEFLPKSRNTSSESRNRTNTAPVADLVFSFVPKNVSPFFLYDCVGHRSSCLLRLGLGRRTPLQPTHCNTEVAGGR